jgi:hypothetical protein
MPDGRIPCIRPACRRTAPLEKYGEGGDIVCGKCWKTFVPGRLKHRYKLLNARLRRANRKRAPDPIAVERIETLHKMNWWAIRRALIGPVKPEGLDAFLEETGL